MQSEPQCDGADVASGSRARPGRASGVPSQPSKHAPRPPQPWTAGFSHLWAREDRIRGGKNRLKQPPPQIPSVCWGRTEGWPRAFSNVSLRDRRGALVPDVLEPSGASAGVGVCGRTALPGDGPASPGAPGRGVLGPAQASAAVGLPNPETLPPRGPALQREGPVTESLLP